MQNYSRLCECDYGSSHGVKSCVFARQGGKPGAMQSCRTCGGRGIKVTLRQLGPGMVQQMQSVCPECRGEGLAEL